jgi:hypothetical protein
LAALVEESQYLDLVANLMVWNPSREDLNPIGQESFFDKEMIQKHHSRNGFTPS